MADGQRVTGADAVARSAASSETLSQFIARVLHQLALSAWLPSAALVLLLAFVTRLSAAVDEPPGSGALDVIGTAFGAIAETSVGGAVLLVVAVVVLTIVTQAFSFEAIRVLEGYWGTNRLVEWFAQRRCDHHRRVRKRLDDRLDALTERAWHGAAAEIDRLQQDVAARGGQPVYTPNMVSVLGAQVLRRRPLVTLTDEEMDVVRHTDWRAYAPADLLRRRVNVQTRLRDFPAPDRMLPTRLGNVIRHYEDGTGRAPVEQLVQDVFDTLPPSLRAEHDEQRTRLDLYCSMVMVVAVVVAFSAVQLADERPYLLGAVGSGLALMWLVYRAAVATARAYGPLLVRIAAYPAPHGGAAEG